MTVPPTAGWEDILTVLLVCVSVATAFCVIAAAAAAVSGRSEWLAWLDARRRSSGTSTNRRSPEVVRAER